MVKGYRPLFDLLQMLSDRGSRQECPTPILVVIPYDLGVLEGIYWPDVSCSPNARNGSMAEVRSSHKPPLLNANARHQLSDQIGITTTQVIIQIFTNS